MKLLLLLLVPFLIYVPKSSYEGVVNVDGVSKTDLYQRARRLLIDNFKNTKGGIQSDDKESGIIIAKGFTQVHPNALENHVNYIIEIDVKDGKYRYQIDHIEFEEFYNGGSMGVNTVEDLSSRYEKKKNRQVKKQLDCIEDSMNDLIKTVKEGMNKPQASW
jgi:hypothetical protein